MKRGKGLNRYTHLVLVSLAVLFLLFAVAKSLDVNDKINLSPDPKNDPNLCGNGIINSPEQCDDGNNANGDGCSSGCLIESGYTCSGTPSVCGRLVAGPTGGTGSCFYTAVNEQLVGKGNTPDIYENTIVWINGTGINIRNKSQM